MKALTLVILFFVAALSQSIKGQTTQWIEFSPEDELFRVSMPRQPEEESQRNSYGELRVSGKRYTASAPGTTFTVWSFENLNYRPVSAKDADAYLDACAELVWESVLKPAKDDLPKDGRVRLGMTYVKELASKPPHGREYSLTLGEQTGTIRFYFTEAKIYVLLAMNSAGGPWESERFFESFAMRLGLPRSATLNPEPGGVGPGVRGDKSEGATDYNRIFSPLETTERARVLDKPEPTYTESARKFGVQGTVVLRAVFSKDAQVTNIIVVKTLPHGLTQAAVAATKRTKFVPATKDGHAVSQWVQLEYNFNLY